MRFGFDRGKSREVNGSTASAWRRRKKYSIKHTLWTGKMTIPSSSVRSDGAAAAFAQRFSKSGGTPAAIITI
jgi:hypothetical protein